MAASRINKSRITMRGQRLRCRRGLTYLTFDRRPERSESTAVAAGLVDFTAFAGIGSAGCDSLIGAGFSMDDPGSLAGGWLTAAGAAALAARGSGGAAA